MKHSKIVSGLMAMLFSFSISSCKDDEAAKTRVDLLTQHTWKIKSGTPADNALVTSALNAEIEYTFVKGGTYTAVDGRNGESIPGTWEFNGDQTELITDKGTDHEISSVITLLDESKLEFTNTSSTEIVMLLFEKK